MKRQRNYKAVSLLAIFLLTLLFLGKCLSNQFTNWDDRAQLLDNPLIREFSFQNLKKIFSSSVVSEYHPLVTLLFNLEYHFFGTNPFPYHFNSLLLHLANGILVFSLIFQMTRKIPVAWVGALLFEIHPLQVQSVAWISDRKDLLLTLFFLASFFCYYSYQNNKKKRFYFFSLLFFICALLSKATAVTLPLVFIFSIYLKKKRVEKKDWAEIIPFICLALTGGWIAWKMQMLRESGSAAHLDFTFENVILAFRNLKFYLVHLCFPVGLSAVYFFPPRVDFWAPVSWTSFLLIITLFIGMGLYLGEKKHLVWGAGFFLITLFPVLRLIPFAGMEVTAHRFVYLPSIGFFYLIGWGFFHLIQQGKGEKVLTFIMLAVVVIAWGNLGAGRCRIWKNSQTLWTEVIEKQPEHDLPYHMLANYYFEEGQLDRTIRLCDKAISLNPAMAYSYLLKGKAQLHRGDVESARITFEKYIEVLQKLGMPEQAEQAEKQLQLLNP